MYQIFAPPPSLRGGGKKKGFSLALAENHMFKYGIAN